MAIVNLTTIKNWFKTGLKPTQTQFWSTWDSFWHKEDSIPQTSIQNLENTLAAKAEEGQFTAHLTDAAAHAALFDAKANDADISTVGKSNDYNDLDNIPLEFNPIAHTHPTEDIEGIEDYALKTYVQGMVIEFDTPTTTLVLKDADGNPLASVNLGALNNEGTSLSYNSVDKTIELRNDANELLAAIPVGDFVANLASTAQWDATTLNRLNFKSSSGATIFYVDFSISRISGLQGALDTKLTAPNGTTTQYIRGDGTVANFKDTVNATVIDDVEANLVNTPIANGNYIKVNLGRLQGQVNERISLGENSDIPVYKIEVMNTLAVTDDVATLSFVKDDSEEYYGTTSLTAPGTLTVTIPHGMPGVPTWADVTARNAAALPGEFAVSWDSTNIILTYTGAAPAGTLEYNIAYRS
ncbi:hypothetical protein [Flavobacterium beibuense]|uniref:hypothetical protein n=1 Tax=Flavobacterium beibuense TaxID=657326 RepID=UPI003A9596FD